MSWWNPYSRSLHQSQCGSAEDEKHAEQLGLYTLLWSEDRELNPDGVAVSELVIAYPHVEVRLAPPAPNQLEELRQGIVQRIREAEAALSPALPVAAPGDYCGHCPVRGFSDMYWEQEPLRVVAAEGDWLDLQGVVESEHGIKSYRLRDSTTRQEILVRTPSPSYELPVGSTVSLLNARRQVNPDAFEMVNVGLTSSSEVLEVAT